MSKKKEYRDDNPEETLSEEPADSQEQSPFLNTIAAESKPQPAEQSVDKPKTATAPKLKKPLFSGFKAPPQLPLAALADKHGTSAMLLAAVKAEHDWSDDTRLTESEYLAALEDWLQAPAGAGRQR